MITDRFQFSIGDAETCKQVRDALWEVKFQFSIGDARQGGRRCGAWQNTVSILYWRCGVMPPPRALDLSRRFNSLLEMLEYSVDILDDEYVGFNSLLEMLGLVDF